MYYNVILYKKKKNYKILSNNPQNANPYYNIIKSFRIRNNIIISEKIIKLPYDISSQLGYANASSAVGIAIARVDDQNTTVDWLYFDIDNVTIDNGLFLFNVTRYIWSDIAVYNQLCIAGNSQMFFERANYYPYTSKSESSSSYLIGIQNDIKTIDVATETIISQEIGKTSQPMYLVAQFTMRNAKSSFTESSYSNYIKTFVFELKMIDYFNFTRAINIIQTINAYYGEKANPFSELQNCEININYVVPGAFISDFIDSTTEYLFKTVDGQQILGYGLKINSSTASVAEQGYQTYDYYFDFDTEATKDKINKKYYIGTLGNLIEFRPIFTKYGDADYIRVRVTLSNELFNIGIMINDLYYDFTNEFSGSVVTNSQATLSTDKLGRTLGIIGTAINGITSIIKGNFAGGINSAASLLDKNKQKLQGGTNANGNYNLTYSSINGSANDMIPFKIVTYESNIIESDIIYENGIEFNNYGTVLATSQDTAKQYLIIQDDGVFHPLFMKGDLQILIQQCNNAITKIIKDEIKNGLYYIVV